MKAQHTPGPWKYESGMITDARGNIIASRHSGKHATKADGYGDILPVEADYNARLIAAAPALLAACKSALDGLYSYRDIDGNCSARNERDQLKASIAQVEGGA